MRGTLLRLGCTIGASFGVMHCGTEPSEALTVELQASDRIQGSYASETARIDFASTRAGPLAGDVKVHAGSLTYDVHYDFEERKVVTDGHGGSLDRATHGALLRAIESLSSYLGRDRPDLPLQEQLLYASLSLLRDSGGMQLKRKLFALGPKNADTTLAATDAMQVDKARGDDGVRCVKRGRSYYTSFDYFDIVVIDDVVEAGVSECNGQCGPACTQLQPWRMWTLDCLEHDACCDALGQDDESCWTPLGECGDEYDFAMTDFLRGFDPFSKHCGG